MKYFFFSLIISAFIVGCAGTVPSVPADFSYSETGAKEHAESLRTSVQTVIDGGWNPGRYSAILERIDQLGLTAETTTEWIDWFSFQRNILIELKGNPSAHREFKGPTPPASIIYFVAHYDKTDINPLKLASLFVNGLLDEVIAWSFFSEGAIDNATGVSIVLELAKALKKIPHERTYRFLLVGSEESGLRGSRAHVARLSEEEWRQISVVINIDSVGAQFSPNAVITNESDVYFVNKAHEAARQQGIPLENTLMPSGASGDHVPFSSTSFPLDFFRGISMNLPGGLLPQRSWFTSFHGVPVLTFAAKELIGIGDFVAGLILLPVGQIHGPRDRAEDVSPTRLYELFAILRQMSRNLDQPPSSS